MTKLERVKAALRGEPVDRPPYAFWTHFPGIDLDPARIAEETAAFCARYDLDFVKSMRQQEPFLTVIPSSWRRPAR